MGHLIDEHDDVRSRFYRAPNQRWMNSYTFGPPQSIWQEGDLLVHMVSQTKNQFADAWAISNHTWEAMIESGANAAADSDADRDIRDQVSQWWDSRPSPQ